MKLARLSLLSSLLLGSISLSSCGKKSGGSDGFTPPSVAPTDDPSKKNEESPLKNTSWEEKGWEYCQSIYNFGEGYNYEFFFNCTATGSDIIQQEYMAGTYTLSEVDGKKEIKFEVSKSTCVTINPDRVDLNDGFEVEYRHTNQGEKSFAIVWSSDEYEPTQFSPRSSPFVMTAQDGVKTVGCNKKNEDGSFTFVESDIMQYVKGSGGGTCLTLTGDSCDEPDGENGIYFGNNVLYPDHLSPIIDDFLALSLEFLNRRIEVDSMAIYLAPISESYLGTCYYGGNKSPEIELNSNLWYGISDIEKRLTLYHELGHCVLLRDHIDAMSGGMPVSIMYPTNFEESYYTSNADYYHEELFSIYGDLNRSLAITSSSRPISPYDHIHTDLGGGRKSCSVVKK